MSTPQRVLKNRVYTWAIQEVKSTLEPLLKEDDMSEPISFDTWEPKSIEEAIQDEVDAIWGISSEVMSEPKSPGIIVADGRHIPPGILGHARKVTTTCKPIETKEDVDTYVHDVFRNLEREAIQRKKLEESLVASTVIMSGSMQKSYDTKGKKPKYKNRKTKKPWRRTF
jgi:dihydropteroate synthase